MRPLSEFRPEKTRMLIVDDDADLRVTLADYFESRGFNVVSARCGADAVELLASRSTQFDIVLTDLVMPGGRRARRAESGKASQPPGARCRHDWVFVLENGNRVHSLRRVRLSGQTVRAGRDRDRCQSDHRTPASRGRKPAAQPQAFRALRTGSLRRIPSGCNRNFTKQAHCHS